MKQILIKEENAKKIQSVLDEAQKRAKVRKATVYDVYSFAKKVFDTVTVPKKLLDGVTVFCDPNAQDFPSAYKYTPESTIFKISIKNGKLYLKEVYRGTSSKFPLWWYIPTGSRRAIADALLDHATGEGGNLKSVYFDEDKIRKVLEEE